jgi:hypothetical protein
MESDFEKDIEESFENINEYLKKIFGVPIKGSDLDIIGKLIIPDYIGSVSYEASKDNSFRLKPGSYLLNTDTSDKPGTHWLAMIIKPNGKRIIWDSYGRKKYQTKEMDLDPQQTKKQEDCGIRSLSWLYLYTKIKSKAFLI